MTATRRPDVLGVHSLDHFSLTVPDLDVARAFYEAFGLEVRETSGGLDLYAVGAPHRWASLVEGPAKRLRYLSFGAYADDVPRLRARLRERGIAEAAAPAGLDAEGVWLHDPDGALIEIRSAAKSSADAKSPVNDPSAPPGARTVAVRAAAPVVRPQRLSHVLIFARDVLATIAFYEAALGLRLSDEAQGFVGFMHGAHGSDHHILAFGKSGATGYHHSSWIVDSVGAIGVGAARMAERGYRDGWGLGRHVIGSNYFHYVRDPWGSFAEYSADIDYIPSRVDWTAGHFPIEDALSLWGPEPPADFVANRESA